MIAPRPAHRCSLRLALTLVVGATVSCKSSGGVPAVEGLRPADEARATLLATVSVAPLDTITGDVDALARTLGLPFSGKDLLTNIAAQNKLDPAATAHVDTAKAIALALVSPKSKDQPPL